MSFLSTEYEKIFFQIKKKEDDDNKLRLLNNLITKIKVIDKNILSAEEKVKMEVLLNNIEIEIKNVEHIIKEFFEISAINQNKGNLYSNNNPVNQPYNNQQYPNNNPINPPQNPYPPQNPNNNPANQPYNNQQYPNNNPMNLPYNNQQYPPNNNSMNPLYNNQRYSNNKNLLVKIGCVLCIIDFTLEIIIGLLGFGGNYSSKDPNFSVFLASLLFITTIFSLFIYFYVKIFRGKASNTQRILFGILGILMGILFCCSSSRNLLLFSLGTALGGLFILLGENKDNNPMNLPYNN
ncbi:hypothetical protein [Candidatus Phytoplasma solani]|uniref:hypothetical protein n=1 Tax=Candidatus Phytoplasma solani TaxID=69896 RepID=UPI00359014CF